MLLRAKQKKGRLLILTLMLCLLAFSCSGQRSSLSVQSQYLRREQLASFHVGTPDPMLYCPLTGQRVIVEWSIPYHYLEYNDLHIEIVIRFGDRSEMARCIPLDRLSGLYFYELRDEEFCEKGGIRTYKVDLMGDGCILETWHHQLWTELIHVGE